MRFVKRHMRRSYASCGLVLALALGAAPNAHADWLKPGKKDQIKLGQRAADDVRKHEKVLPDKDQRVVLLRRVAGRLMAALPPDQLKDWQFSFDIVDSKEVNAFALPGGPVFFYTGLVDKLKTEDELAGVLAHEMTHVTREHWASAYADNTKRQLGIGIVLTIIGANKTAFDIASVSDDLLFGLPYSRRHETEADEKGFDTMVKAGYNPEGMARVFEMLQGTGGSKSPEWASTHPDDKRRVQRIRDKAAKSGQKYPDLRPLPWIKTEGRTQSAGGKS